MQREDPDERKATAEESEREVNNIHRLNQRYEMSPAFTFPPFISKTGNDCEALTSVHVM